MKQFVIVFLAVLAISDTLSQVVVIEATNPAAFDRPNVTVELPWREIRMYVGPGHSADLGVFLADSQLVSQMVDNDGDDTADVMIFQSGFLQEEKKTFTLKPSQGNVKAVVATDVKYILPRKDVAWENDRIAFRIYGGPLAGDVLNGLDVWCKRVRYNIMDKWYLGDSLKGEKRVSYHVDHGEGADFFLVGRTLGAGGSARLRQGAWDQAGMFASYKIMAEGPIRSMFEVTYKRDSAGRSSLWETKTYTLDAGMNLNKIELSYPAGPDSLAPTVIGLVKRANTTGKWEEDEKWLSVWGPTDNDSANGFLGTGIVVPAKNECDRVADSLHETVVVTPTVPNRITYYAGAGWTRSGDFASQEAWEEYLSHFANAIRYPLQVTISMRKK